MEIETILMHLENQNELIIKISDSLARLNSSGVITDIIRTLKNLAMMENPLETKVKIINILVKLLEKRDGTIKNLAARVLFNILCSKNTPQSIKLKILKILIILIISLFITFSLKSQGIILSYIQKITIKKY